MPQIARILAHISSFSVLIPIFLLLIRKQNFKSTPIKVLGILLFVSGFSDLISYIIINKGKSNIIISNVYTIVEFFLLSCVYYFLLNNKKIIYTSLVFFTAFFIINTLFIQSLKKFQSWPLLLETLIVLSYSVSYYRQLLKTRIDILRFSYFWFNTAVYFYFAFDLFLFAITNYIIKNMPADVSITAWSFHNFNNTVKNLLFLVAIYYVGVKQNEQEIPKWY